MIKRFPRLLGASFKLSNSPAMRDVRSLALGMVESL